MPDIDLVVQWKLPGSMSSFVQRAGRVARDPRRKGLAVLLVEKSAYGFNCEELGEDVDEAKKKTKGKAQTSRKLQKTTGEYVKGGKGYAESRGVKRGSHNGKCDKLTHAGWSPVIDRRAKDENLLAFVQTGCCRRAMLTAIFDNYGSGQSFSNKISNHSPHPYQSHQALVATYAIPTFYTGLVLGPTKLHLVRRQL